MRTNPKAIKSLKRVMPDIETRKAFVANCIKQHGEDFEKYLTIKTDLYNPKNEDSLFYSKKSFSWGNSSQGYMFWRNIFKSLTPEERKLKLFVK